MKLSQAYSPSTMTVLIVGGAIGDVSVSLRMRRRSRVLFEIDCTFIDAPGCSLQTQLSYLASQHMIVSKTLRKRYSHLFDILACYCLKMANESLRSYFGLISLVSKEPDASNLVEQIRTQLAAFAVFPATIITAVYVNPSFRGINVTAANVSAVPPLTSSGFNVSFLCLSICINDFFF